MKKLIYHTIIFLFICTSYSYSSHHEIYQELSAKASKSCNFSTGEEAYKKGISYRNGEEKYPKDSLQSIIYGEVCFKKSSDLYRNENNFEGFQKAYHNLAMLRLRIGDIPFAKYLFESIPSFSPSQNNLKFIQTSLESCAPGFSPFVAKSNLSPDLQKTTPYGLIHKDWSEHVYNELIKKGITPLKLATEELQFSRLTPNELKELQFISKEIEKITNKYENACIVMLGRSPILVGMMMKIRNKCRGEIVNVPLSGVKTLNFYIKDQTTTHGFMEFLNDRLPLNHKDYFVVDMYQTGQSFNYFGILNKNRIPKKKLHGIALIADNEIKIKETPGNFEDIISLPKTGNLLFKTIRKEIFDRTYVLPGMSSYPKDWKDKEYRKRLMAYDPFIKPSTPMEEIYWEQMVL